MLRAADRIRDYVKGEIESGHLSPGARLPSYRDLALRFGMSYLTARNAMLKLEQEHMIEIKNHGSFLAGGRCLKVLFHVTPTTISCEEMRKMLVKHLANIDRNLEIDVRAAQDTVRSAESLMCGDEEYDAVISFVGYKHDYENCFPAIRLDSFPEHQEICSRLIPWERIDMSHMLPFSIFTYQMGVNGKIMREIGFDPAKIKGDFLWWNEYVEKCRKKGRHPAGIRYTPRDRHLFSSMIYPMLSILPYDKEKYSGSAPLLNTKDGERFFQLLMDSEPFEAGDSKDFLRNGCAFSSSVGSWITTQNNDPDRKDIKVDELEIIPYRTSDGRKITFFTFECLELYLSRRSSQDDSKRILRIIQQMYSHEFQVDYCGRTGTVSVLKDVYPAEYYWNRKLEWNAFIPGPDDLFCFPFILFDSDLQVAWSILLENLKFYNANTGETALRMDQKKI